MTRQVASEANLRQAKRALAGETLANILRRRLADEILAGVFLPGDRLDEQQIADRFKVSRTPVREALRVLAASGLAELRPHRGVVVTMVDDTKLVELFEVTGEVDALCARLAAERMTAMERQALLELEAEGSAIAVKREFEAYAASTGAFTKRFSRARTTPSSPTQPAAFACVPPLIGACRSNGPTAWPYPVESTPILHI
ncbi:MAG: GntR family transcriptional regulator [Alphaproteobacteria bacterium]|nr:GntR family transcriptional regulator [Alphaproteobacteria bacterium]